MNLRCAISFILLFSMVCLHAQTGPSSGNSSSIRMKIKTSEEDGNTLTGVTLKIFQDTLAPVETQTKSPDDWYKSDGAALLNLGLNKKYTVSFAKVGYISFLIIIDTHMSQDQVTSAKNEYELDVKMFKEDLHPLLKNIAYPLALIQYNAQAGKFLSNKKYAASILSTVKSN